MSLLRADKLMESVLGFDKTGIGQLRSVEYAKKYQWEVSFGGKGVDVLSPPAPFEDFFPAVDLDMDEASLETYNFEQYMSSYEIPWKSTTRHLTLTFNDNNDNVLFKWLSDWINIDIQNHGHFISALLDDHRIVSQRDPDQPGTDSFGDVRSVKPLRKIKIAMLSPGKAKVLTRSFLVFPTGKLNFNGSQASQAQVYTMTFAIVTQIDEQASNDKGAFLDKLKAASIDLFGRFI